MQDIAPPNPQLPFSPNLQVPSTSSMPVQTTDCPVTITESGESGLVFSYQDDPSRFTVSELSPCLNLLTSDTGSQPPAPLSSDATTDTCLPLQMDLGEGNVLVDDPIIKDSKRLGNSGTLKDRNGARHRSSSVGPSLNLATSAEKLFESARVHNVSIQKKRKADNVKKGESSSQTKFKRKKVEGKKGVEREDEENDKGLGITPQQKKRKRMEGDVVTGSRLTKRTAESKNFAHASSQHAVEVAERDIFDGSNDSEARILHATVCGMVIETMATSRASSLPVSSIYKLVMNSQPALKSQRTEDEWLQIFERVLRSGEAGRGSGVFGKVESSGKDHADRRLEAQWFYVPERDEDQERAALIRSMMPRPGKRMETMKYKQYYWRPLGKISKWDPEDAL